MTTDAYGRLAKWQDTLLEPLNAPLRDIAMRLCPPHEGMEVLDVGCGTGVQLQRYAAAGCRVAGIDPSPAMLERAKDRLGDVADLRLGRAQDLPYPDESFDLVSATLVLHELAPDDGEAAAQEMLRVVRPAGELLITEFHPGPWVFPKGWIYRAVSLVAETVARHRDRSQVFLANGGVPGLADRLGVTLARTKVVAGGNMALYVIRPVTAFTAA